MGLIVQRKPRETPIPDIKPNFKPFERLNLHLVEFARKVKKGLPLIPIEIKKATPPQPQKTPPQPVPQQDRPSTPAKAKETKETKVEDPLPEKKHKKKHKKRRHDTEEDDLEFIDEDDLVGNLLGEKKRPSHRERFTSEDDSEDDLEDGMSDLEGNSDDDIIEEKEEDEDVEEDPYAGLTPEEREAKEKEEYIWRFKILKKKFGNANTEVEIPSYNEFSDLGTMKLTYDRTIKELYLDDAVESYRMYLVGGSMIIEFICTQYMDVDLGGFVVHQTKVMHKYDRLLIELGEKSYNQWGMTIPVEIRLFIAVMFQAGIFYLAKVISSKYGGTAADMFRGITGQPPPIQTEKPKEDGGDAPPKKRMTGPKIKPEDLRQSVEVEDDEDE